MLINDIITETTSGGIAIVAKPLGKMQKRPNPSVFAKNKKRVSEDPDPNDHTCDYCKGSGYVKWYDDLKNKPNSYYSQKPEPKCAMCDGTGKKVFRGEATDPKADPKIVAKFARTSDKLRSYYIMKWAEEKGIDGNDAMCLAGYVKDGYIGAGSWNWAYRPKG